MLRLNGLLVYAAVFLFGEFFVCFLLPHKCENTCYFFMTYFVYRMSFHSIHFAETRFSAMVVRVGILLMRCPLAVLKYLRSHSGFASDTRFLLMRTWKAADKCSNHFVLTTHCGPLRLSPRLRLEPVLALDLMGISGSESVGRRSVFVIVFHISFYLTEFQIKYTIFFVDFFFFFCQKWSIFLR